MSEQSGTEQPTDGEAGVSALVPGPSGTGEQTSAGADSAAPAAPWSPDGDA